MHLRLLVLLQLTHQVFTYSFSIGDDNVIYKWNVNTGQSQKWIDLDSYAVDHDWMPFSKGSSDIAAVGFSDGTLKLINKNGKVEKHMSN